jgi:hypothetical protein
MIERTNDMPTRGGPRVQRYSTKRLLRKPVELPSGVIVAAERHKGQLVVRVVSPDRQKG